MGNGNGQVPLSVISFTLIQHSKVIWAGPVRSHLSTVVLISAMHPVYLQTLGSFGLEPLKQDANKKVESRKYVSWFQTQGAKALNHTSEDADSQWAQCRFVVARSEDKCSIGSWVFARSPLCVCVP